jgi:hypothetical protein
MSDEAATHDNLFSNKHQADARGERLTANGKPYKKLAASRHAFSKVWAIVKVWRHAVQPQTKTLKHRAGLGLQPGC